MTSESSSLQQPPWVSVFSAREQLGHPVPILVSAPASHRPGASSQGIRTDWPARCMSSESCVTSLDPKCPEGPSLGDAPSPMVLWKLRTPSLSWEDGLNFLTPLVLTAVSAPRTWSSGSSVSPVSTSFPCLFSLWSQLCRLRAVGLSNTS